MQHIKNINQFMTGVFLVLVSWLAFYLAWPLSSVTDVGLGPGFVPKMFAAIQFGLGTALVIIGFLKAGEVSEPWHLRPLIVLAAIAFFGVSIDSMGLVVSLVGLVLIACTAHSETTFREALALAFGSAVLSAVLFVKLLGLSIPVWPQNLPWS
jgi:Tripartite tricarboxylate transporter TctB family